MADNLNHLRIAAADGPEPGLEDPRATSADGSTSVLFRSLETELITRIRRADAVLGCVAWLTHPDILAELAKKETVAIVVQKEDFLRPDLGDPSGWPNKLRRGYDSLSCKLERLDHSLGGTRLYLMSCATDPSIQPIRCIGNHNSERKPAFPRAHHKFLIFCSIIARPRAGDEIAATIKPYEVWTGSFNLTRNATHSLENAIVSTDAAIVRAFFAEWAQLEALSEPLDWTSEWTAPEWRIGT